MSIVGDHLTETGNEGLYDPPKKKPFNFSHSSLKAYETCPRRYEAERILKLYPKEETEATIYGTEVHADIENYINGQDIHLRSAPFKSVVDACLAKPGVAHPELELGVKRDLSPCGFKDPDVWARGIIDLAVVDEEGMRAHVVDWKTGGNKYPDIGQLRLMSLLIFAHFPVLRRIDSALLFLLKGTMNTTKMFADDAAKEWWKYRERTAKIENSLSTGVWNPQQNGLCRKYCPVDYCEFNGRN